MGNIKVDDQTQILPIIPAAQPNFDFSYVICNFLSHKSKIFKYKI